MSIQKIKLTNIRNIQSAEFELTDKFNLFYGKNGSGKTSVLEAVYLLSLRKSFRTHISTQIIKNNQNSFTVFSKLTNDNCIGIEKRKSEPIIVKKNGELGISTSDIASILPLQLINTEGFGLLDAGPKLRRQFIDWGLFHVEQEFFKVWKNFNNALVNRNTILKQRGSLDHLKAWDSVLAQNANIIDSFRKRYINSFQKVLSSAINDILDIPVEIKYNRGWREDTEYADILAINIEKDKLYGYTQYGPQRADMKILAYQQAAHTRLSRGQLKLVMCALKIAQGQHLFEETGKKCLYLVDDIAAELDHNYISKLVEKLHSIQAQVLVTGIELEHLKAFDRYDDTRLFHVKHGCFYHKK
jgi:DNA replication and repair protein RecF